MPRPYISLKFYTIYDFSFSSAFLRSENSKMAFHNFLDISLQDVLPLRLNSFNKRSDKTHISTAMSTALILRNVSLRLLLPEVRYRERLHIANNFPMTKVQPNLTITDGFCEGYHGERGSGTVGELDINHLIVAYVVRAFVNADTVRAVLESFCDIFNIRKAVNKWLYWPARMSTRHWLKIDW